MNVVFRVDASKKVGNGHFYRCLNLAETLKNNHKIYFISKNLNGLLVNKVKKKNINLIKIKNNSDQYQDAKFTINKIKSKKININVIILDSYKLGINWQKTLYKYTDLMFVIDDLNRKNYADVILNQNLNSKIVKNKKIFKQKFLLGPKYCILNKNYSNNKVPNLSKKIRKILIFMGGADSKNYTSKILNIVMNNKFQNFDFNVVVGQNNFNYKKIIKKFSCFNNINITYNADNLINLIKKSDLVISSLGSILWEVLYFKKPIIGFIQNQNQKINSKVLNKNNYIQVNQKVSIKRLEYFLFKNLKKSKITPTQKISIDGKGVFRVRKFIEKFNDLRI